MENVEGRRALILGIRENKTTLVIFCLRIQSPTDCIDVYFYRSVWDRRVVIKRGGEFSYYDNVPLQLKDERINLGVAEDVNIILHESRGANYRVRILAPEAYEVTRQTFKYSDELLPKGEIDVCAKTGHKEECSTRSTQAAQGLSYQMA